MASASNRADPIKLAKLFENLSPSPLYNVHSQLNAASLVLVCLASEKWNSLDQKEGMQLEAAWDIDITEDEVRVQLSFEKNKKMDFGMSFKEDSSMTEEFEIEHNQESNFITFSYQTASQLEASCFKILRIASELFLHGIFDPEVPGTYTDTEYGHIILSLGSRSPDFPFRLLSKLPCGCVENMDLQGDLEVDFGDFLQFTSKVSLWRSSNTEKYDIGVRFKNLVMTDEDVIADHMKIADARFMTRKTLQNLNVRRADIGENHFTSQDFNALFRSWTEVETNSNLFRITFALREDQKITMEEVTEGLNPYVGKPRIRDRWHLDPITDYSYSTAIDCDKGWDIRNFENDIGIILLEANRLTFCTIPDRHRFRRDGIMSFIEGNIRSSIFVLRDEKRKYERVQKEIVRAGENASHRLLKLWDSCTKKTASWEKRLVELRETQEMMKLWTNDD